MSEESPQSTTGITASSKEPATQRRLPTPPGTASPRTSKLPLPEIKYFPEYLLAQDEQATGLPASIGPHHDGNSELLGLHATSFDDTNNWSASKNASPYGRLRPGQPKIPIPDPVTGVFGSSYADAVISIIPSYWKPPMGSTPFPTSDRECQLLVRQLRDALLNTTDTKDNKTAAYKAHWTPGKSSMVLEWQADRVCWEILSETMKLHKYGFVAPIFERDPSKHVDKDLDFGHRITALVKLLSDWKSICEATMKGEKLIMFIAGPVWSYNRCEINKQGNAQRKQIIEAGKSARAKVGKLTDREKLLEERRASSQNSSSIVPATKRSAKIDLCGDIETVANDERLDFFTTSDGRLDSSMASVSSPAPRSMSAMRSSSIDLSSSLSLRTTPKSPTSGTLPTLGRVLTPSLRSSPIQVQPSPSPPPSSSPIIHTQRKASLPLTTPSATNQNLPPLGLESTYKSNPAVAPVASSLPKRASFPLLSPLAQAPTTDSGRSDPRSSHTNTLPRKEQRPVALELYKQPRVVLDAAPVVATTLPKPLSTISSTKSASKSNNLPPLGLFSSAVPRSPLIRTPASTLPPDGTFASVVPAKRSADSPLESEKELEKDFK